MKFFDAWSVVQTTDHFLYLFIGGRGIGKTYSVLKGNIEDDNYIMYVRRTETELKNRCKPDFNPYITINRDIGTNIEVHRQGDSFIIADGEKKIGVAGALTTFGKFRGSDFSNVDYIIFDEFIRTNRYKISDEETAFFNMIETVQRNREILGQKSIKVILLSNANTIDNAIIKSLKLGEIIHQMKKTSTEVWTDSERGIYPQLISNNNDISRAKAQTALYKLTKGTEFYDMSIGNEFVEDSFDDVKKVNYRELMPIVAYDNIYFYKVKNKDILYCSYRKRNVDIYTSDMLTAFKRGYGLLFEYYITNKNVLYYDYDIKLQVQSIF